MKASRKKEGISIGSLMNKSLLERNTNTASGMQQKRHHRGKASNKREDCFFPSFLSGRLRRVAEGGWTLITLGLNLVTVPCLLCDYR